MTSVWRGGSGPSGAGILGGLSALPLPGAATRSSLFMTHALGSPPTEEHAPSTYCRKCATVAEKLPTFASRAAVCRAAQEPEPMQVPTATCSGTRPSNIEG